MLFVQALINESLQYGLNDYDGVMWDILTVLLAAIKVNKQGSIINFLVVINWKNRRPKKFDLIAKCGALDIDDPQPAITIMLQGED